MAAAPRARPTERAQLALHAIRSVCTLVEHDGKPFAACDNSTPMARVKGPMYLPQIGSEWEAFTKQLVEADQVANGKRRPVVVLNRGDVVAESTSGGVVKLKR